MVLSHESLHEYHQLNLETRAKILAASLLLGITEAKAITNLQSSTSPRFLRIPHAIHTKWNLNEGF